MIPIDDRDQTQDTQTPSSDDAPSTLPKESLEQGSSASTYVDNPDKPDPSTVAQIEKLPDES